MATNRAEVLLHPIRLRIVLAMGSDELTTAQLAERLPDIAHATLYRHVAVLAEAGMLSIVDERRVRGGVERTYAIVAEAAHIGPSDAGAMSQEVHMRGFVTFVGSLIEAFGRYLAHPAARPGEDRVGYRQASLWLTEAESAQLAERLASVLEPYLGNAATPERGRVLLNTILIPELAARDGAKRERSV